MNCLDCHDDRQLVVPAVAVCVQCGAGCCREHSASRTGPRFRFGALGREDLVQPPARLIMCNICDAAERATTVFAREALAAAQPTRAGACMTDKPVSVFACVHNGGRSLAAKVLTEHYANGTVDVRSVGSDPGDSLNPVTTMVVRDIVRDESVCRQSARKREGLSADERKECDEPRRHQRVLERESKSSTERAPTSPGRTSEVGVTSPSCLCPTMSRWLRPEARATTADGAAACSV
jgi:hypothetical protein